MMQLVGFQVRLLGNDFAVIADVASASSTVIASEFSKLNKLAAKFATIDVKRVTKLDVIDALTAYQDKEFELVSKILVNQNGPSFTLKVWREIAKIRPGESISYQKLAGRAGNSAAVRAAASACRKNAVPLFVPCHRVIPSSGEVGNYVAGSKIKLRLLQHEFDTPQTLKLTSLR
jgi:methylated-DNA-[protein]-cysteine S-methyltransferase